MKIIKSKSYMKKEAIWSNQDPGLPLGVSEELISEKGAGPEEDTAGGKQGESEIDVNWPAFNVWFSETGDQLPDIIRERNQPSTVQLLYTYSYDYNDNAAGDIKSIQLLDYLTKQVLTDPYFIQSFADYHDEQIKFDINMVEEDARIERSPGYNPFE